MIRVLQGDCRDVLPTLEAGSVHTVVTSPPYYALRSYLDASHPDKHREIGSEATPDEYIQTMVGVFREVRRVLRDDGTCWVNVGDSYSGGVIGRNDMDDATLERRAAMYGTGRGPGAGPREPSKPRALNGAKPKNLLMMPARLALALQADGWWLRSDIIWAKPNPMPESVTDRPTSAHEHVFLLTKRSRYFYDADAVREDVTGGVSARNLRNVWTIATEAFPDAHFATFPTALVERCIKAGTSERGCCAACGKPWVRQIERVSTGKSHAVGKSEDKRGMGLATAFSGYDDGSTAPVFVTTGWSPGCQCNADTVPCVVLDPFGGAGTTGLVADRLQRDAILIDLNMQYIDMAMKRLTADAPLFADVRDAAEDSYDQPLRDLFEEAAD